MPCRRRGAPASRARGQPWLIDPALAGRQYERGRRAAARLINADPEDVALISSVSYGVAAAAKVVAVPAGSHVLVLANDHSSAVLEWVTRAASGQLSVEAVPQPDNGDWTAAVLAAIERLAAERVYVAPRIGRMRISPHVYNDEEDIDRFVETFRRLAWCA